MKVAILGCGPAGLMAAHAVKNITGETPKIYSNKLKSQMFGAMYLHKPIPGITPGILKPEFVVDVVKVGRRDGYARLVYGNPDAPCSWDEIKEGLNPAWNLTAAYNELWELYADDITNIDLLPGDIWDITRDHNIVFSTVPAPAICKMPGVHEFSGQRIWVIHGPAKVYDPMLRSLMYYNGYPPDGSQGGILGHEWYRYSKICGYEAWEYTTERTFVHAERGRKLSEGTKPLATTCDCWPEIIKLGRFGAWRKGVLTHHAYEKAEHTMVAAVEYA